MKFLAAVAVGCLVWFVCLVSYHPDISYDDGFETECGSIVSGAPNDFLGPLGGTRAVDVVRGDDVVHELEQSARDRDITDEAFVQRQLGADCTDRRVQVLMWSQVVGGMFLLSTIGAIALCRPSRRPRRPSDITAPTPPPRIRWQ